MFNFIKNLFKRKPKKEKLNYYQIEDSEDCNYMLENFPATERELNHLGKVLAIAKEYPALSDYLYEKVNAGMIQSISFAKDSNKHNLKFCCKYMKERSSDDREYYGVIWIFYMGYGNPQLNQGVLMTVVPREKSPEEKLLSDSKDFDF